MISQTAEYALRAVVALSQNPGKPMTTAEIAQATKVPEFYLSKVLHGLAKGEIVLSKRGVHGGYLLNDSPDRIPLLRVIDAVDPIKQFHSCPLKLNSHIDHLCSLHKRINESVAQMKEVLENATIQTILEESTKIVPLCEG